MKNICFLSHSSELNGAELNLLQVLEGIDRFRFYPHLIVPREGLLLDEAKKLGIEAEVIPSKWWLTERSKVWKQPIAWIWNKHAVLGLARWIKQKQIDLVFSNSSASSVGALSAKKAKVPHIWYIHELLGGATPQLIYMFGQKVLARKIGRYSCRVLVNSMATEAFFSDKTNVQLVYNGVQLQDEGGSESQSLGRQWGLNDPDIVFGMVGKICEEKGQREVITALGMLGKDHPLKLLIVGGVKSKVYFAELKEICSVYDIKDRVIFTGYQRDVFGVLGLMDCLIVASSAESFGRTIIEAMSVKIPVIAVKSGGIPEILSHGINGFLLSSRKPEEIKKRMASFLDNREIHIRAAEMGCRTVQEKFSLSSQVKIIENVLEECLGEIGGAS
jgi:glycosyltransferase involved in cell wall biosynthesis